MKKLKNIKEKDFKLTEPSVLKLHESAIECLKHDIYEGSLVLAQAKLEKVIKRVLSAYARKQGYRTKDINQYIILNNTSIVRLCDIGFKNFELKNFQNLINDNFIDSNDRKFFQILWDSFIKSSKDVRNDTIHQIDSNSPSFIVYSTKNIFYLTDLIVKSCLLNIKFQINPAESLSRQKIPKPKKIREIDPKEKKTKKDYIDLKEKIIEYEKYVNL
jgi:hypothetical protein